MTQTPELFVQWECFVRWLLPKTACFPRRLRPSLTSRIENHALDVFEAVVEARYGRQRAAALDRVSLGIEKLRLLLRLAHDLRVLDTGAFSYACQELERAGRMAGGWRRHTEARA